jgi:hypothetical protein
MTPLYLYKPNNPQSKMRYATLIPATSFLLSLASATPTTPGFFTPSQAYLTPQCGTTITPTIQQRIDSSFPNQAIPPSNSFWVSQTFPGNVDTLVQFTGIPAGSYDCALNAVFPDAVNYPVTSTGNALLNVYVLNCDIQETDSYETYFPKGGSGLPHGASFLWGTATLRNGGPIRINSEACNETLNFLFEIASETAQGSVAFTKNVVGLSGLYVTYDC